MKGHFQKDVVFLKKEKALFFDLLIIRSEEVFRVSLQQ